MFIIKKRYKRNGIVVIDNRGKTSLITGKKIELYTFLGCLLMAAFIIVSFMFLNERNKNQQLSDAIAEKNMEIIVLQEEVKIRTETISSIVKHFDEVKASFAKIAELGGNQLE